MFIPLKDLNPHRTYPFVNTGLILANILLFFSHFSLLLPARSRLLTSVFVFLFPIPAVITLGYWFVLQFLSGLSSLGAAASGGVAWWAHVGGFLLGMLITMMARRQRTSYA